MHQSPEHLSDCACTTLRMATRAVTRLYDEMLEEAGLSIVQFSMLRTIGRDGPLPLSRLADSLVMERTTLYRGLAPLEKRGWLSVSDIDGRTKTVELTADGRETLERASGYWQLAEASLFERIGKEEWAQVQTSLAKLVATARENRA